MGDEKKTAWRLIALLGALVVAYAGFMWLFAWMVNHA